MTRIDRKTALRRAAAPSIDFSLLPGSPAVQVLDEEPVAATPANSVRVWSPKPRVAVDDAQRFDFPARPGNHPTLQPFDAPLAAALAAGDEDVIEVTHQAFVMPQRQQRQPAVDLVELVASMEARRSPSRVAARTLRPTVVPVDDEPTPSIVAESRVPATTVDLRDLNRDAKGTVIDDEEVLPAGWALEEQEEHWLNAASPMEEEVDGELNDWMRRRTRARFLALGGSGAIMTLLTSVAIAGLWVTMGRPVIDIAPPPAPVEEVVVAAAAPVTVSLTVQRGDTFHKLLAAHDVDVSAMVRAAGPVHNLGQLEVGDELVLVMGEGGESIESVRYVLDAQRTLVLSQRGAVWVASVERITS